MNYRQLHKESVRENRPAMYRDFKRSGELRAHLDDIASEARDMHARIVRQMAESNPYNPADWDASREAWEGALERTARELVLHDLILVPDEETERAMREGYED
jgi:hypothetical protein